MGFRNMQEKLEKINYYTLLLNKLPLHIEIRLVSEFFINWFYRIRNSWKRMVCFGTVSMLARSISIIFHSPTTTTRTRTYILTRDHTVIKGSFFMRYSQICLLFFLWCNCFCTLNYFFLSKMAKKMQMFYFAWLCVLTCT